MICLQGEKQRLDNKEQQKNEGFVGQERQNKIQFQTQEEFFKASLKFARKKKIDHYFLLYDDLIGKGSFAKVYKGLNIITNEIVAIKVMEMKHIMQNKLYSLLQAEIEIFKALKHPNIVRCYDILITDNNCYIVTELCNNGQLTNYVNKIKNSSSFPEVVNNVEIESLVYGVYQGLLYLQRKNIIHRDLKLSNILVKDGIAKIGDFGFASFSKDVFIDAKVGSPIYMSPQAVLENVYGPKTDVWAFGILLYQLYHGYSPFQTCKNYAQLTEKIKIPFTINKINPEIPQQIKKIITACLTYSYDERPRFKELWTFQYIKQLRFKSYVQKKQLQFYKATSSKKININDEQTLISKQNQFSESDIQIKNNSVRFQVQTQLSKNQQQKQSQQQDGYSFEDFLKMNQLQEQKNVSQNKNQQKIEVRQKHYSNQMQEFYKKAEQMMKEMQMEKNKTSQNRQQERQRTQKTSQQPQQETIKEGQSIKNIQIDQQQIKQTENVNNQPQYPQNSKIQLEKPNQCTQIQQTITQSLAHFQRISQKTTQNIMPEQRQNYEQQIEQKNQVYGHIQKQETIKLVKKQIQNQAIQQKQHQNFIQIKQVIRQKSQHQQFRENKQIQPSKNIQQTKVQKPEKQSRKLQKSQKTQKAVQEKVSLDYILCCLQFIRFILKYLRFCSQLTEEDTKENSLETKHNDLTSSLQLIENQNKSPIQQSYQMIFHSFNLRKQVLLEEELYNLCNTTLMGKITTYLINLRSQKDQQIVEIVQTHIKLLKNIKNENIMISKDLNKSNDCSSQNNFKGKPTTNDKINSSTTNKILQNLYKAIKIIEEPINSFSQIKQNSDQDIDQEMFENVNNLVWIGLWLTKMYESYEQISKGIGLGNDSKNAKYKNSIQLSLHLSNISKTIQTFLQHYSKQYRNFQTSTQETLQQSHINAYNETKQNINYFYQLVYEIELKKMNQQYN